MPHLEWGKPGEYLTDRLTDEALAIIDRAGDRPFFLYLAHHAVHTPIEAKTAMIDHYAKKVRPEMRHRNAAYAAMTQSLDESVGRVLAKIDERGLAGRTVIVFTSDNGGLIDKYQGTQVTDNHPLRSGKGSLYEGGIRVPLVVRWPGQTPPGQICREPAVSTDLYATLLEMAGLSDDVMHNAEPDGRSLARLLRDPAATLGRPALFFHYPHYYSTTTPVSAVRAGNWKLLEYLEDHRVELYNLADDLGETKNLATENPVQTEKLKQLLHGWRDTVRAQMPVPNPNFKRRAGAGARSS